VGEPSKAATYKHVRALERGLALLAAVNRAGRCTIPALAAMTGVDKATTYRMIATLESLGYVRRAGSDDYVAVASRALELSNGFDDEGWVTQVAAPLLGDLFRRVVWPTDIATFDRNMMVIRETTHRMSPYSFHRSVVGMRVPVLQTAVGRAYLSFLPEASQRTVIEALRRSDGIEGALARMPGYVEQLISETRERGFASSVGEAMEKFASLAVPIFYHGDPCASLNILYLRSSVRQSEAVERFLEPLRTTAAAIEAGLTERPLPFEGAAEFIPTED
jgi:IclR family mhp operon transcriptional activator